MKITTTICFLFGLLLSSVVYGQGAHVRKLVKQDIGIKKTEKMKIEIWSDMI